MLDDQDTARAPAIEGQVDQTPPGLFAPAAAARSTRVLVRNHGHRALYLLGTSTESGHFAPGLEPPAVIAPRSLAGWRVESREDGSGVTGAVAEYGLRPTDQYPCLWLVTSNPPGNPPGSASCWNGQGYGDLLVQFNGTAGAASQVEFDVREAAPILLR
jgi:hypothetical protein